MNNPVTAKKIPFFLVTGFLGSGKTTLLKRILLCNAFSNRIAIVQNEFAPSGIDGIELKNSGAPFELMEINHGSVFCVCLLGDFTTSLGSFADRVKPDAVFLEATGLADPIAIAQLFDAGPLSERFYLAYVWCIVDATNFLKIEQTVRRVVHQVRVADTIIINKTDSGTANIAAIEQKIREYNPYARIVNSSFCQDIPVEGLLNTGSPAIAQRRIDEHKDIASANRPPINSCVIRYAEPISEAALEALIEILPPQTIRMKGYVKMVDGSGRAIQSVFGATTVQHCGPYTSPTELVAMGEGLDPAKFIRTFESIAVRPGK